MARRPRSDEPDASEASLALGMLVGYLLDRHNVSIPEIHRPVLRRKDEPGPRLSADQFTNLRRGLADLEDEVFDVLRGHVAELLRARYDRARFDHEFLLPALRALDLEPAVSRGRIVEIGTDFSLVCELKPNLDGPRAKLDYAEAQASYYSQFGGLWYLIRQSTDRADETKPLYNVSLLSIKPPKYKSSNDSSNVHETLNLRFSVRSRIGTSTGAPQTFRGRIVSFGKHKCFIGARKEHAKFFQMMLQFRPHTEIVPYATSGSGLIVTVNADDDTIATPVVAIYLEHARFKGDPTSPTYLDEQSAWYQTKLDEYGRKVGAFPRAQVEHDLEGANGNESVGHLLSMLDNQVRETREHGYLAV